MKLTLRRTKFFEHTTIGRLYLDEHFLMYTLEDKDRSICSDTPLDEIARVKVQNETAIPYGTYEIRMTYSNRFKKLMPELIDVPGFTGIRIHPGNNRKDTAGCILPGLVNAGDKLVNSKLAYANVITVITEALKRGKLFITITK